MVFKLPSFHRARGFQTPTLYQHLLCQHMWRTQNPWKRKTYNLRYKQCFWSHRFQSRCEIMRLSDYEMVRTGSSSAWEMALRLQERVWLYGVLWYSVKCGVWPWWQRMSLCDVPIRSAVTACSGPAEQTCAVPCNAVQRCSKWFSVVHCGWLWLTVVLCGVPLGQAGMA